MALDRVLDTLDGVDDAFKSHYTEKDGKFILEVNGAEDVTGLKSALEKERGLNKTTSKALKEMQEKFKDIDPEVVRSMMEKAASDKEKKLLESGDIDKVVEARLEKHREDAERRIEKRDGKIKSLAKKVLTRHFTSLSKGLHDDAIGDMIIAGLNEFTLDDNADPVKLGSDGQPVLGKDGKTNLTPSEWLEERKADKKHWFLAGDSGGDSTGMTGKPPKGYIKDPVQRINASRGVKE